MEGIFKYERIGSETECGNILNSFYVSKLRRGYVRVGGVIMPESYVPFGNEILEMDIRDDDIFLCGHQKSGMLSKHQCSRGTTWCQEMIWCIANNLDFERAKMDLNDRFPFLEMSSHYDYKRLKEGKPDIPIPRSFLDTVNFVNEFPSPRLIKAHLPFTLLPRQLVNFSTKAKIIYVSRNPKDVCVSHYHYSKRFEGYSGDFDMFCKLFLNDMLPFFPYWDHILQFWEIRNNPAILLLTYEEMKRDLKAVIRKTANFLGVSLTSGQADTLSHHLSVDSMKQNKSVNRESQTEFTKKYGILEESGDFIRSGIVGSWKKEMTPDIAGKFDDWTNEKIAGTGFPPPLSII